MLYIISVDTRRRFNVYKTFIRRRRRRVPTGMILLIVAQCCCRRFLPEVGDNTLVTERYRVPLSFICWTNYEASLLETECLIINNFNWNICIGKNYFGYSGQKNYPINSEILLFQMLFGKNFGLKLVNATNKDIKPTSKCRSIQQRSKFVSNITLKRLRVGGRGEGGRRESIWRPPPWLSMSEQIS